MFFKALHDLYHRHLTPRRSARNTLKLMVPSLFTFSNALLGITSIIKALDGQFIVSAYCIFGAAVMDMLDGRLARTLGVETDFGTELDSLADATSFCVAPTVLMYSWYQHDYGTSALTVLLVYVCAGLFRLARFNSLDDDQSVFFLGLPTTLAAFFLANVVVAHDWMATSKWAFIFYKKSMVTLIAFISFLMVSSIRFPSFKNARTLVKHPMLYLQIASLIGIAVLCVVRGYPIGLVGLSLYIFAGFSRSGWSLIKRIAKR